MKFNSKVKRTGLFLLIALILISVCIAGCKKSEEEVTEATSTQEERSPIVENSYVIVRPNKIGMNCLDKIKELKSVFDSTTGSNIEIRTDYLKTGETADDNTYEILIGNTNRTQSAEALSKVGTYGFAIEKLGNKIVINGSNEMMVEEALDYLLENEDLKAGKWIFDESVMQDGFTYFVLGNKSGADFVIKYPQEKIQDYTPLLKRIVSTSKTLFGVEPETVDVNTATNKKYTVYLGVIPTDAETIKKTEAAANGIFVIGNNIYICGNTYTSINDAVSRFTSLIENCVMPDGNVNIYDKYAVKAFADGDIYDIPTYDFGGEANSVENNPGYITNVKNTSLQDYNSYVNILKDNGYTVHQQRQVNGNSFATLYNDETMIHTYFAKHNNTVKIIVEPKSYLPETSPTEIEKITTPSVTQLTMNYDLENGIGGMSYIITLSDSTFIIIDGGNAYDSDYHTATNLLNKMKELNKRPDGKIIINAWIITHAHTDHYQALKLFSTKYAKQVTLNQIIINIPSGRYAAGTYTYDVFNNDGKDIDTIMKRFSNDVDLFIPHTGQEFYIKNIKVEALYTYEDFYPNNLVEFNNSSMVLRTTIEGQTIMWGADNYVEGCNIMNLMWSTYLKSDIVQMPHHGYTNAGGELWYKMVGAKVALWPRYWKNINQQATQTAEVRRWLANAGTTEIYVADPSDVTLNFPYLQ